MGWEREGDGACVRERDGKHRDVASVTVTEQAQGIDARIVRGYGESDVISV